MKQDLTQWASSLTDKQLWEASVNDLTTEAEFRAIWSEQDIREKRNG